MGESWGPCDAAGRRRILVSLAGRPGLRNLRAFGSAARGTGSPGSDLGILVTRAPGTGLVAITASAVGESPPRRNAAQFRSAL
ncbi:hypothetical protein GCG21_11895 [Pseudactinotalea sp. HY160]|nr:hypothetical protein [Pseudactinotalea sp. HY160]